MTTRTFGKYHVTRSLGRGGMAEVYQAHDPVLDRLVAIKVILPHLTADDGFTARFLREAKLVASLRHPQIVQLFDYDVVDGQPFMVMEYLGGDTLKARLAALRTQRATMTLREIARWLESSSLTKLGHALAALGQTAAATERYQKAVNLWREQGRPDLALESVAGLARIALDRADLATAKTYAEELVAEFDDTTFPNHGMAEEFLTCYRVLRALQDARADEVLGTIYNQVQASAARIGNEQMQRSFLENVPAHQAIINEWHATR